MSDIHVTYDGDTYWLQCFSDDPSAEKGIIVDPIDIGDSWVTLAEKVAEHEAQHGCSPVDDGAHVSGTLRCAKCGTNIAEPEAAKVIVVRDALGRDQQFAADGWDAEEAIDVTRNGEVIATYPSGHWQRVHKDGVLVPVDLSTERALGIAKRALEAVTRISDPNVAIQLATDALEEIFAETE